MYSPLTGRYLTRDSWQGDYNRPLSLNRWNYVEGNPVNRFDPSGMVPCSMLPPEDQVNCTYAPPPDIDIHQYDETRIPDKITFSPKLPLDHIKGWEAGKIGTQLVDPNNTGLCGPASVAWIVSLFFPDVSIQDVTKNYTRLLSSSKISKCVVDVKSDMCKLPFEQSKDPNYNGVRQMAGLVNVGYGHILSAKYGDVNREGMESRILLYRSNIGSHYLIAGVMANGSNGMLRNGAPNGKFSANGVYHFVVITGISDQWENYPNTEESPWKWVRVFNPFNNRPEYYWWGDFYRSWARYRGGDSYGNFVDVKLNREALWCSWQDEGICD
jgi:hypothetical protein